MIKEDLYIMSLALTKAIELIEECPQNKCGWKNPIKDKCLCCNYNNNRDKCWEEYLMDEAKKEMGK